MLKLKIIKRKLKKRNLFNKRERKEISLLLCKGKNQQSQMRFYVLFYVRVDLLEEEKKCGRQYT